MDSKNKCILRKIVEKFYEQFIDDEELSDDMKKERLLDIRRNQIYVGYMVSKPSSHQVSPHDDQKHKVPVKSTMSSSNCNPNGTTGVTQQPVQANGEGDLDLIS